MRPVEFLALLREKKDEAPPDTPAAALGYCALEASATAEYFLTLHTSNGQLAALAYSNLTQISGDEMGGTRLRLRFSSAVVDIAGRGLGPVFEAVRTRRAAHLHQLDTDRAGQPEDGQPVILSVNYAAPAKATTKAADTSPPRQAADSPT